MKEQAQKAAQMRYEEWVNSEEYHRLLEVTNIGDSCISSFAYFLCILLPTIQGYVSGNIAGATIGFFIGILLILFLNRFTIFRNKFHPIKAIQSLLNLMHFSGILFSILFIANFIIFFTIGLSTVMWMSSLIGSYLTCYALILWLKKRSIININLFKQLSISGGIVSLFLCINFYSSSNSWKEEHYFMLLKQDDSLIEFNDRKLDDYIGIRLFNSIYPKEGRPKGIIYTFEHGGLGLDVVKDYEFMISSDY